MIHGKVTGNDEPVISIYLQIGSKRKAFQAVIDTGFNGYLSAPQFIVKSANWEELGIEEYELASGERMEARVFCG